jgi:uncharacterized protein DUF6916
MRIVESLDKFNAQIFAEQIHTTFKVRAGNPGDVSLELIEVNERETTPKMELFSLVFRGPVEPRLNQHIHPLRHEKLGSFDLFLTPVGLEPAGALYEAVFHRFRKPQP